MGASLHHTCGCSHIPLSIPGKIKRQNCTQASCSLLKKPSLHCAWGAGVEGGESRSPSSSFGESRDCVSHLGKDSALWVATEDLSPPGGLLLLHPFPFCLLVLQGSPREGSPEPAQCLAHSMCSINRECGCYSLWTNTGFPSPEGPGFPLLQSFLVISRKIPFTLVLPYFLMPPMAGHFSGGREQNFPGKLNSNPNIVVMANIYFFYISCGLGKGGLHYVNVAHLYEIRKQKLSDLSKVTGLRVMNSGLTNHELLALWPCEPRKGLMAGLPRKPPCLK